MWIKQNFSSPKIVRSGHSFHQNIAAEGKQHENGKVNNTQVKISSAPSAPAHLSGTLQQNLIQRRINCHVYCPNVYWLTEASEFLIISSCTDHGAPRNQPLNRALMLIADNMVFGLQGQKKCSQAVNLHLHAAAGATSQVISPTGFGSKILPGESYRNSSDLRGFLCRSTPWCRSLMLSLRPGPGVAFTKATGGATSTML